jgi:hypothetical protein
MSNTDQLKLFLSMFVMNLPTVIVCVAAGVVLVMNWRQGSTGSLWALLGFGLLLVLCFVIPIGQTMLQQWVFQSGQRATRMWAFSTFAVINSVLHAVVYAFLLVAVFAGRSKPDARNSAAMPPIAGV